MLTYMISQYSLPELEAFLASIPLFAAVDEVTRRQLAEQLERCRIRESGNLLRLGQSA
jgi:hypothetical protein